MDIFGLAEKFYSLAQMQITGPDQWKFEEILYRAGLFPRNQAGDVNPSFEKMWTKILETNEFYDNYTVNMKIPANSFSVQLSVKSPDKKAKKLEQYLNTNLAPKMTNIMTSMNGKVISGTNEKFGPSNKTHLIQLISTT